MTTPAPLHDAWTLRIDDVWRRAPDLAGDQLVAAIDALAAERPATDGRALFERACARDTAGLEAEAEPLYRAALESGQLDPYRRTRAVIQLASTLRWLDRLEESEALLVGELTHHLQSGNDRPLHDEARALLALTYAAQGRGNEAAGLALATLAPRLSRYNRSMLACAKQLAPEVWEDDAPERPAFEPLHEGAFVFRPYRPEDLSEFVAGVRESEETVGRWMGFAHAGYTVEEGAAWFARCTQNLAAGTSYDLGIFDRETGAFVGGCGLNHFNVMHPLCNLGYWVRRSCEGRGVASAAVRALSRFGFGTLKIQRIEIVVAVGNEPSQAVARKAGAHYEGVLRNRLQVNGVVADAHMFSLVPPAAA
ncbi:tetratricopeptide repeat protein [Mitsuaria sp. GD03876]|uniref:tetratricopeptide repeat protein n=1 Tax=Mitsuaria sp. GD03876 TaxID=2975399 RepID=UPI002447DCA2|nr:tetratricopeptide repeat protein [Mitsuaria sp. GD03876]MDH0864319.1 tetratricopeptide repeat protein [Mitsuaria sp. GD03876]